MSASPSYGTWVKGLGIGLLSGLIFSFLLGEFDPARYLIEQLTIIPFEAIWITVAAYVTLRYGLFASMAYLVSGSAGAAIVMSFPVISITGALFLKTAVAGILIGALRLSGKGHALTITAASIPGVILAGIVGFPYLYGGVSAGVLAKVKQEALDTYLLFMTPDDARNAADNAMSLLGGVFGVSFAILVLGSIAAVWISVLLLRWVNRKREAASGPAIIAFSLPFPVMWVFLASFGLVLAELKLFYPVALNVLIITAGLYGVQGMAVIAHFMRTSAFGRMPRILFWLMFFITLAFSTIIVVFIGIIDNWFHLRSVPSASGAAGGNEGTDNEGDSQG